MKFSKIIRLALLPLCPPYLFVYKLDQAVKFKKQKRLPCPVISIGNLNSGGTGKTPFTIWLAKKLKNHKTWVLTRGYGTGIKEKIISPGDRNAHDEPGLIARKSGATVSVHPDRYSAGIKAGKKADLFILDDGFQHRQLYRDLEIILINASHHPVLDLLLPAGDLRTTFSELKRADIIILNRKDSGLDMQKWKTRLQKAGVPLKHVFTMSYKNGPAVLNGKSKKIRNSRILAFCGLAEPESFFNTVKFMYPDASVKSLKFQDHNKYTPSDLSQISKALKQGWCAVTTEKDISKLGTLQKKIYTIGINVVIKEEKRLLKLIKTITGGKKI